MDADYDFFEIVAVTRDFWLIDAESYQRSYCTSHGHPLVPGYYVVNWPETIRVRRFNEQAAFHGPFELHDEAQAALNWMHKKRKGILTLSSEIAFVAVPNFNQRNVKEADFQELRLAKAAKLSNPIAVVNYG
jgi:hypothetical protein